MQCPTTIADVARCKQLTGIDNCAKCWESGAGPWWSPKGTNGKWCTLCVSGFYFNWNVNSANFGKVSPGGPISDGTHETQMFLPTMDNVPWYWYSGLHQHTFRHLPAAVHARQLSADLRQLKLRPMQSR